MFPSFLPELDGQRAKAIQQTNDAYHATMTEIFRAAIKSINFTQIKQDMLAAAREAHPFDSKIRHRIVVDLDPLYETPHTFWFRVNNAVKCHTFKKEYQASSLYFNEYFYTKDPDVYTLRNLVKAYFPDATVTPFLNIVPNRPARFELDIVYNLTPIEKLVDLESTDGTRVPDILAMKPWP